MEGAGDFLGVFFYTPLKSSTPTVQKAGQPRHNRKHGWFFFGFSAGFRVGKTQKKNRECDRQKKKREGVFFFMQDGENASVKFLQKKKCGG